MTAAAHAVATPGSGQRMALDGPADELHELADTIDGMLELISQLVLSKNHQQIINVDSSICDLQNLNITKSNDLSPYEVAAPILPARASVQ